MPWVLLLTSRVQREREKLCCEIFSRLHTRSPRVRSRLASPRRRPGIRALSIERSIWLNPAYQKGEFTRPHPREKARRGPERQVAQHGGPNTVHQAHLGSLHSREGMDDSILECFAPMGMRRGGMVEDGETHVWGVLACGQHYDCGPYMPKNATGLWALGCCCPWGRWRAAHLRGACGSECVRTARSCR